MLCAVLATACNKPEKEYPNPYQGGKPTLGVKFSQELPTPQNGEVGDVVTYKAEGLLPHKDVLKFYMNGELAQVVSVTDKGISIRIPPNASSGGSLISIGDQLFPAPVFRVTGKVSLDRTFQAGKGTNGFVSSVLATSRNRYLVMGSFTEYGNVGMSDPLYGLILTEKNGAYVPAFKTDSAVGRNGSITAAVQLPDGKFILAGSFSQYGRKSGIANITRIHEGGLLDSTIVRVIPTDPGGDPHDGDHTAEVDNSSRDTVPVFNGGFNGSVRQIFLQGTKVVCIGNLLSYRQYYYPNSTRNNRAVDYRSIGKIARLTLTGDLDSTYHYDLVNHRGKDGPTGSLNDGVLLPDGKLLLVGAFRSFDGVAAGNIARLTAAGDADPGFNAGSGADDIITNVYYNKNTRKLIIAGAFKNYNGKPRPGLAMINEDGSLDETFVPGAFEEGRPYFSGQLSDGKVIVTGTFRKYSGVTREGFMILNPDGKLAQGYNNTGRLNGTITSMMESVTAEGEPAVILTGFISSFDNTGLGGIMRIVLSK